MSPGATFYEYHVNLITDHRRYKVQLLDDDRLTTRPPDLDLEALAHDGIIFLGSVNDAIKEGNQMQHCVASYAQRACQGACYLFHIEYEDEQATIEVGRDGRILQAHGPHDLKNRACEYGTQQIKAVFKPFGRSAPYKISATGIVSISAIIDLTEAQRLIAYPVIGG